MEDAEVVPVRDRGEDEVDGRKAVVRGTGELALGVDGAAFDRLVDVKDREREQLLEQISGPAA